MIMCMIILNDLLVGVLGIIFIRQNQATFYETDVFFISADDRSSDNNVFIYKDKD